MARSSSATSQGGLFVFAIVLAASILVLLPQATEAHIPIIIDNDLNIDDMMSFAYAVQKRGFDLKMISNTGAGWGNLVNGTSNLLRLLTSWGKTKVKVYDGEKQATTALGQYNRHFIPPSWQNPGVDDLWGITLTLPAATVPLQKGFSPDIMADFVKKANKKVRLVSLGGLGNVYRMFKDHGWDLAKKLEGIWIMGGAVFTHGNVDDAKPFTGSNAPWSEWNIFLDPFAAHEVFSKAKVPLWLIPLDATKYTAITSDFFEMLTGYQTTPEAKYVHDQVGKLENSQGPGFMYWYFWDPVAMVAAMTPNDGKIFDYQVIPLVVDNTNTSWSGRLIVDGVFGTPVNVATFTNRLAFEEEFVTTLNYPNKRKPTTMPKKPTPTKKPKKL